MDSSEQKHIYLSWGPIDWYDYSVIFDFVRECREAGRNDRLAAFGELEEIEAGHLARTRLANILVTATTLVTTDGFVLYSERKSVSANSGLWSCSVAENIHREKDASITHPDIPDPHRTVVRGIAEELSPEISRHIAPDDIVFLGVTFDLDELNPAMLFLARPPLSLEEICARCLDSPGKDYREGVQHWLPGDAEEREWPPTLSDKRWSPWVKHRLSGHLSS